MPTSEDIIDTLKDLSSLQYLAGMARFGIDNTKALGVKIPEVRKLAKIIKKDHQLALELWDTDIHEARILATLIADHVQLTPTQMDHWTHQFVSWDVCDQACGNLFWKTPFAMDKVLEYTKSEHEFVKRAGFVLMAEFAVHQKKAADETFYPFFPIIKREAWDGRNFVKKAVNWALRQIGKRNEVLREAAIECAERVLKQGSKSAKWIAKDALKELSR
ncbi:DNA alkylation repair protein [Mucilaginibacter myungsuensis]|uniref:DNA alkylation repair protein n=1 Tax=Mucilaginibacter myungsuensis TaxID=649104 RepID=A0A929KZK4_9SPHI|nr:DNA alkylation repair protein [Mucilaginibacter myungsuensis]MBE9662858.1 DNA alkylation repair protein [Mucilaginibacter myungsuensis]MDN3598278.1 DNA alkylation repair protein [Mucilaginibacter myungsuensis]